MKLSQTSFISFLLSTILLFYAMKKIHILILSVITFTCFSCQINPEKPDVPLNKNDAFQKVQKRHVQEKR